MVELRRLHNDANANAKSTPAEIVAALPTFKYSRFACARSATTSIHDCPTETAAAALPGAACSTDTQHADISKAVSTVSTSSLSSSLVVEEGKGESHDSQQCHDQQQPAASSNNCGTMNGTGSVPASSESCAICFDEFQADDEIKELPCHHFYHVNCIDSWLARDVTCPLCKQPLCQPGCMDADQSRALTSTSQPAAGEAVITIQLHTAPAAPTPADQQCQPQRLATLGQACPGSRHGCRDSSASINSAPVVRMSDVETGNVPHEL